MKKSIFTSKTLWVNVLMCLAVVLPDFFNLESVKIPKDIAAFIVLFVNVILRFMTNKPVAVKKKVLENE